MDNPEIPKTEIDSNMGEQIPSSIRTLKDLIDQVTGRNLPKVSGEGDSGLAELWPYPFFALVGQEEMKLSLLLTLINPRIGGVLLIGSRGTGKTSAVRGLTPLMPDVSQSNCFYGCIEEDVKVGGMDSICPDCAIKVGYGEKLSSDRSVRLIELPLNAELGEVVGKLKESDNYINRQKIQRGILSYADKNLLYIDEVNLLSNEIVDVILDASAQGSYTVKRGSLSGIYRSRFTLVGTMNPEEGNLRPQILDRFGLRVIIKGLESLEDKKEAYRRVELYNRSPQAFSKSYQEQTELAAVEIIAARKLLLDAEIDDSIIDYGLRIIGELGIFSTRASISLFECAKAHAVASGRVVVTKEDVNKITPMSLRYRNTTIINKFFEENETEENNIIGAISNVGNK